MTTILNRLAVGPDLWQVEEIRNELFQDIVSLAPADFTHNFPSTTAIEAQLLPFYLFFAAKEDESGGDGTLAELFWAKMQVRNQAQKEYSPVDLSTLEGRVVAAKQAYRHDWNAEVKRLENARFINSAMRAKCLSQSLISYGIFGRLLELRELYKNTHYLFIHGQGQKIAVCNDFMKATVQALNPERNLKHYQVLRYPTETARSATAAEFLRSHRSIDDMAIDGELLSVDAYFWSRTNGSSAQHFFAKNSSATNSDALIAKAIQPALADIGLGAADATSITRRLYKISAEATQSTRLGNLYVICVPKENIEDPSRSIGYTAHPRGKPCRCYSEDKKTRALRALQEGRVLHRCSTNGGVPQYRLLAHHLDRESGIRSHCLSPMTKSQRKELKGRIKGLVGDAISLSLKNITAESLCQALENGVISHEELLEAERCSQLAMITALDAPQLLILAKQFPSVKLLKDVLLEQLDPSCTHTMAPSVRLEVINECLGMPPSEFTAVLKILLNLQQPSDHEIELIVSVSEAKLAQLDLESIVLAFQFVVAPIEAESLPAMQLRQLLSVTFKTAIEFHMAVGPASWSPSDISALLGLPEEMLREYGSTILLAPDILQHKNLSPSMRQDLITGASDEWLLQECSNHRGLLIPELLRRLVNAPDPECLRSDCLALLAASAADFRTAVIRTAMKGQHCQWTLEWLDSHDLTWGIWTMKHLCLLDVTGTLGKKQVKYIFEQSELFNEIKQKIPALLGYFGKSRRSRYLSKDKPVNLDFKLSKIKGDLTPEQKLRLGGRLEMEGFRLALDRGCILAFFEQAFDPRALSYAARIQLLETFLETYSS